MNLLLEIDKENLLLSETCWYYEIIRMAGLIELGFKWSIERLLSGNLHNVLTYIGVQEWQIAVSRVLKDSGMFSFKVMMLLVISM